MRHLQTQSLIVLLALTLLGTACDNNTSTTGPGEETATVEGKVEDDGSQNKAKSSAFSETAASVEGATVTAARITADGSLETISGAETETSAEGEFSLNIDTEAAAGSGQQILILAEQNSQQWKAFLTAQLESGSTVQVQPLTEESSAEADVLTELIAEGHTDLVSKADIEAYIGSRVSSEIRNNTGAASSFAEALVAEAQARAEFFAGQSASLTQEQKQQVMEAKNEAQVQLESELHAATTAEQREAAMETFAEAIVSAHADADIDAGIYAMAREMSGRVLVKHSSELSAEAASEVRTNVALLTSHAIDAAVQTRMETADVAESNIQLAADAALALRSDIKATSGATKEDIDAAFDAYNESIVDILSQEFSASSETITNIHLQINQSNGAKASLESSLEATIDTQLIADAYATFISEVRTIVEEAFSAASEAEVQLVADVMILANLAN
ncbi:hypothetical protein ACG2F4_16100 [Halalkalibaculum sp. DA3122]|uniref:hypothetical protein n=1 Tax=Halalkalibaculum sp. DA3122 TaxID=3373607 RepID=UPI003754DFCD